MRRACEDDIEFIDGLFRLPHVMRFLEAPGRAAIEATLEDPNTESYVIEERGKPAGHFLLHNHEWLFVFNVMAIRRQRRGAGTFALRWALHRAFVECAAHRVFLEIREDNRVSRGLCEKLGFVAEGRYRDGFRDARGRYRDLVPYGMLESNFMNIA